MTFVLNLDKNFKPCKLPEIEYDMFKFSSGEIHIKVKDIYVPLNVHSLPNTEDVKIIITNMIRSSDNLMSILIAKNALNIMGFKNLELIIPYVPYVRYLKY